MASRIPVAVAGATGLAGQQFLAALDKHPQLEVVKLAASHRSAGKPYAEAIRGSWSAAGRMPASYAGMVVEDAAALDAGGLGIVFSALEAEPARELEPRFAAHAAVLSTASAFRYEPDVPVLVPGVIALDILDNIIPYIAKEEEKVDKETRKILGSLAGEEILPAPFAVSCTCTRVPVLEGHTESVFVELSRPVGAEEIVAAWRAFGAEFCGRGYPSSPEHLIHVHEDPYRPQVRLDRDTEDGMATVVGRLRPDPALENGWKFLLCSHNTKMGAAKGCILCAEHLIAEGIIA